MKYCTHLRSFLGRPLIPDRFGGHENPSKLSSTSFDSPFLASPNSLLIIPLSFKALSPHLVSECQTHCAAESAAVAPVITPLHSWHSAGL